MRHADNCEHTWHKNQAVKRFIVSVLLHFLFIPLNKSAHIQRCYFFNPPKNGLNPELNLDRLKRGLEKGRKKCVTVVTIPRRLTLFLLQCSNQYSMYSALFFLTLFSHLMYFCKGFNSHDKSTKLICSKHITQENKERIST